MSKRYDLLPSYYYEDNIDGILLESVGRPLRDYKIYGENIQGGVFNSDTTVEIESVGEKITNIVDIDHIIENNPTSTTSLQRVTFQDKDCLRWSSGGSAGNLRILQGKFKENTAYTIRMSVASSTTDGVVVIVYTDGTTVSKVFGQYTRNFTANSFSDLLILTRDNKTVDYITGSWRSGQSLYIDISKFMITEGTDKHPYIAEKSSKYKLPIYCMQKNIANPDDVYSFVSKINYKTNDYTLTRVITDINGREILRNYAAAGHGTDNYEERAKIFKGIFKKNTRYTISFDCYGQKELNLNISYTDGNYNVLSIPNYGDASTVYSVSFTSALNKTIESVNLVYSTGSSYIYIDTIQIEEGVKATKFVPYGEYDVYLDKPLQRIGDYADYIDFKNQKVVRNISEEIVDGNTVLSILDTPIEEPIVLPEINTQKGACTVEVGTTVPPSKTEYQYYREGK